jgi:hypothetical protein
MLLAVAIVLQVSPCLTVVTIQLFSRHNAPSVGKLEQDAVNLLSNSSHAVAMPSDSEIL